MIKRYVCIRAYYVRSFCRPTDVLRSLFILFYFISFIITTMTMLTVVRRCEDEDEDDDDDEDDELLLRYMIKELISSL